MSSLCCRSTSSRAIFRKSISVNFLIQDSVAVQSGQWPRTILVSTNQGGRGHGVAGVPASQLPSIRYTSYGRRWAAVTLDVSASRCVGEGGARRERKSGAEKNRGGKHEFSDREHCCFLSDQFVVFAARCDGQT